MLDLNPTTLAAVVDRAMQDAAEHPRWLNAINRAVAELVSNPWIERGELHGLVVASPSGNVYSANGVCQCQAYLHGNACWHRAAARLVRLHDEALTAQQSAALADRVIATVQLAAVAERQAAYRRACAEIDECFA